MSEFTLGEVLATHGGSVKTGPFGTVLKAAEYSAEGVPLISVGEVGYGALRISESTPRISAEVSDRLSEYVLRAGDVVFGRKGAVDRSAWIRPHEDGFFLGSDGIRVRFEGPVHSRFMSYQLQSAPTRNWLIQHAAGTTMASLNGSVLERVPVTLPPLAQQQAIAEVLGALDDKIVANTKTACTSRDLMVAMASQGGERCQLRDVATRVKSAVKPEQLDGAVDHYSLPAFDTDEGPEVVSAASIKSNKIKVEGPCVLLSKLNPRIPRVWDIAMVSDRPSLASTEFLVLDPHEVSSSVLWAVLAQPLFTSDLKGMVAGTSGSHQRVRPDDVLDLEVIAPKSISETARGSITALGEQVDHVRSQNVALAITRDALLPLLMSGKVTVKDAEAVVEGVA